MYYTDNVQRILVRLDVDVRQSEQKSLYVFIFFSLFFSFWFYFRYLCVRIYIYIYIYRVHHNMWNRLQEWTGGTKKQWKKFTYGHESDLAFFRIYSHFNISITRNCSMKWLLSSCQRISQFFKNSTCMLNNTDREWPLSMDHLLWNRQLWI